ncbi:ABC transporter substrate-binding protein [Corynebacterium callunae]|uniref:ABC transporter substrate-binding protein n=1 Tax=Corynebacterium callunae TaxID=1721 RepID=UPI00200012A3|nr:ABC transporter substrate-binding protein [Corynebacterium callunae]MCK2200772.1 ABC transporter substrate-binding protein [Corynebacterium callunae]
MKITRSRLLAPLAVVVSATLLTACGSSDSVDSSASSESEAIVIGSQDYYSNEIIAEIYAQALEAGGHEVQRDFRIGQREVYVSEIENGSIDLFPEYSGPLLQYWEPNTEARLSEDVYTALEAAAPENLKILEQSEATDQDAYVVTRAFAEQYGLQTIEDLAKVDVPLTLGGNSEGENRPNGPKGLASAYGINVGFTPIEDSGGPLTVKALTDNQIQLAIIYTADPTISDNDLVVLEDTKGLFLASHVVPVASADLDPAAQEIINNVSTEMSPEELIALNAQSVNDQANAADIAAGWLEENPV